MNSCRTKHTYFPLGDAAAQGVAKPENLRHNRQKNREILLEIL